MAGRWGSISLRSVPVNAESSSREPTHVKWFSAQRQIGRGVPQNRSRESAQSTLFANHSPKRPSRMWAGCQSMVAFSASIFSLNSLVATYQLGLPQ